MKKECVIYLGGSITQLSNLRYLRKKKFKIILIDNDVNCYCKRYCDDFLNISQTNISEILFNLDKIIKKKNYKIIDSFGLAHFSYLAINMIKKRYLNNYKKDYFLMSKHVQKKEIIKSKLTPEYIEIPEKKKLFKRKNYFMNKIYNFYKKSNYKVFIKPSDTHQGIGITEISQKIAKTKFIKKYYDIIIKTFQLSKNLYLEKSIPGRLINLDFIKKENGDVIFLPLVYRDKVKFNGKKKYHTVFEYINNKNTIENNSIQKIKKILNRQFKNIKTFGTIDLMQTNEKIKILEISPHFHHVNLFKFIYNLDLIGLYFENHQPEIINKKLSNNKIGGSIFLDSKNKYSENLIKLVKKNSIKMMINNLQTNNKIKYLEKDFLVNKSLRILYFQCKNLKQIKKIYLHVNSKKRKIFS